MTAEFDHPCRQTCSGWQQGFEKGQDSMRAELERVRQERDEWKQHCETGATLRRVELQQLQQITDERDAYRIQAEKIADTLENKLE